MTTRRLFVQALGGTAALGALHPLAALAAEALNQVKILYGFPAGSAGDSVARRVGDKLGNSAFTKNAAVVDNRPGAGGRIALEALKTSPADGSVLAVCQASALSTYPHIYSKLNYAIGDFAPISIGAVMTHGLAVGPMVPASVKTLKDYIAWAKANPKEASYGSPGAGSTPHFLGALLGLNSGTELKHIPYRGSLPAVNDVVGGQIASSMTPAGDYLPFAKAGKLRVLATSGTTRAPYLPDVPTFAEQGFPEIVAEEWFGFITPAKTPPEVIKAANAAITTALKDPAIIEGLFSVGLVAQGSTPEEMKKSIQSEYERWGPLVKKIGFTAES
ncbi:Bug family tripartite tricarboxylate transporter substrate binding protein [Variovorax sp. M-6]|uniref:Bug family tripartite tricarboxylate transporter substrate binding protein n=1 Tax=Variovorax sp. M-6 TaxID=3233041 RepID=UPI003F95FED7